MDNLMKLLMPVKAVGEYFRNRGKSAKAARKTVALANKFKKRGYKGKRFGARLKGKRIPPLKPRGDGNGNQVMGVNHGRSMKPFSQSIQNKVRECLQPTDTLVISKSGQGVAQQGECAYTVFELNGVKDIDVLFAKIGESDLDASKLWIKDSDMTLRITNITNVTISLRIYEYIYRRDLPSSLVSTDNIVNTLAADNGFQLATPSQVNCKTVGGTLYMNPQFCSNCKILRTKTILLPLGRSLKLSLGSRKPRTINTSLWNADDTETEMHYTRGFVVQVQGQVANTSGVVNPNLTIGAYDYIQENRYNFSQATPANKATYLSSSLPAPGIQTIMNSASGTQTLVSVV